jgi:D-alanyl-D-alanine carboxypeptidase
LPDRIKRAAYPLGGAFSCRGIADTAQPSMHSYGAAFDLNISFSGYWYWQRSREGTLAYRNRMPHELVEIFERHGFIWGGKWYHYDTMHFEYRPELLELARRR